MLATAWRADMGLWVDFMDLGVSAPRGIPRAPHAASLEQFEQGCFAQHPREAAGRGRSGMETWKLRCS